MAIDGTLDEVADTEANALDLRLPEQRQEPEPFSTGALPVPGRSGHPCDRRCGWLPVG